MFSDWNLSIWEHIDFFQNETKKARGLENPVNCTPVIAFKVGKRGELEKCGQDMKNIYYLGTYIYGRTWKIKKYWQVKWYTANF